MSHNLFGERFLGKREPAWHGLGTVFTEDLTALEAIEQAGCDYKVFKSQLVAKMHKSWFDGSASGYKTVTVPGKFIITREPTPDDDQFRFFGSACTDQYEILDNTEIGRALDGLTKTWKVDTVGALDYGKVLFVALDAGEIDIGKNGDTIHQYFVFTDRKDASEKARFMFTPVRVVCQNTLVMGERAAQVSAEITHRTGASQALQLRVDIIDRLMKAKEVSIETLQAMAGVEITNEQAAAIISAAYPFPKKRPDQSYLEDEKKTREIFGKGDLAEALFASANAQQERFDYLHERTSNLRSFAGELFQTINSEQSSIANTPWAAYNAVVESADWRSGRGAIEASALFGNRALEKVKAYNAAERLTAEIS